MRPLLVLRPEPGASTTATRARDHGLEPIVVPLFKIEPLPWNAPSVSGFDGLLLTSANAVRNGGEELERLRSMPVYAIGEATAEAARHAGFDVAAIGSGNVDGLLASIDPSLRLLHLAGEDRREPRGARQSISAIAVYAARVIEAPDLSLASVSVAVIHSRRAGRRFAELVNDRKSIAVAAISAAAAEAVGGGWETVEAAKDPNDDALLALAARLCNNPAPK